MQHTSEPELIAQSLNGDHVAYAELVDRYKNAVYRHCFAIVRDEDVAEDMAQDTFITAYYKLHTYNPAYRLSTWLFKIATNKALNQLKRSRQMVPASEELLASVVAPQPGPHEQAAQGDVRRALVRLRPEYRAVVSLYYWQGLSYEEIASVLAVPTGTAKVWMRRAKDRLKEELA